MADDPRMVELQAMALAAMERWRVPGLAVGVLHDGAVHTFAGGVASLETGQPATPETLFQIGSISKVFSTTVLMTLVDEGKVDLDAPISRYLPELELSEPGLADRITVRHLVTHQSGIWGDYFDDFGWGDDALAQAVANIRSLRQTYAPGELWSYCNAGFEISGRIMERVSGQSYEELARERLFKPLGLEHTFFFPHEVFAYPHAVGHIEEVPQSGDFSVARDYWLSRALSPVGSILSTVADLLAFARFHMGDGTVNGQRVLSQASIEAMRTPQVRSNNLGREWGLGWSLDTLDGVRVLSHTGGTNGFTALLVAVPARQFALAVLTNSSSGPSAFREIKEWALERFARLQTLERPTEPLAAEQLARLTGTYRSPRTEITVSRDGEGLSLTQRSLKLASEEPVTLPPFRVRPVGEWDFAGVEGRNLGTDLDFIPGPNSQVRFLRLGGRLHDRVEE
ncbi:MAG TPA: serine hydrolase domain-containing protein [Thermomicrobiaceae bacterium]|nr:serine hydrolase domain-containing protein [Thermomicrobiaceae bacterium]